MLDTMHLTKENVDTAEKRVAYAVSLVGCTRKAILYALAFAEAGFKVKCTDADQAVTRRLGRGTFRLGNREAELKLRRLVRAEQITASSDLRAAAATSDVIILTVNVKIDDKKCADNSEAENVCKQVGAALPKSCLVVYAGVGWFGFTENVVKETLENTSGLKVGEGFGLAYSVCRESIEQDSGQIQLEDMLVAANDKFSLNAAASIFETITRKGIRRTPGIKMAELSTLFAAAKRDLNVALANELAMFCETAGADYNEIVKLVENNTKDISLLPTIAEETNRNEVYLLLEGADNLNAKLRLTALARMVNEDMIRHAVNLTQDVLRCGGKPSRRAKVSVLGSSFEPGAAATLAFVDMLEAKGAKVTRYDPFAFEGEAAVERHAVKKTLNEAVEGTDCVVIVSELEQLKRLNLKKLHALMKSPAAFVDLASLFEPAKVEDAGFTYRGLGRGVWKK